MCSWTSWACWRISRAANRAIERTSRSTRPASICHRIERGHQRIQIPPLNWIIDAALPAAERNLRHVFSLCYQLRGQRLRNLPSVEAAILYKNLVGAGTGNNDASQVDAGNVAFKRHRIAYRLLILSFKTHAHALKKAEVRMIAGEREDKVVLQGLPAMGGF